MQEKLAKLHEVVWENLEEAQSVQKLCYDCHTCEHEFQPGDTVTNKHKQATGGMAGSLHSGKVSGESMLPMPNRRKWKNLFHINMLRKWHPPRGDSG